MRDPPGRPESRRSAALPATSFLRSLAQYAPPRCGGRGQGRGRRRFYLPTTCEATGALAAPPEAGGWCEGAEWTAGPASLL